jgi:hypothetical protein
MRHRVWIVWLCLLALVGCQVAMAAQMCPGPAPASPASDCHGSQDVESSSRKAPADCPIQEATPDLGKLPVFAPLPGHPRFPPIESRAPHALGARLGPARRSRRAPPGRALSAADLAHSLPAFVAAFAAFPLWQGAFHCCRINPRSYRRGQFARAIQRRAQALGRMQDVVSAPQPPAQRARMISPQPACTCRVFAPQRGIHRGHRCGEQRGRLPLHARLHGAKGRWKHGLPRR